MMVRPFLKWAGGKRWLIQTKQLPIPRGYNRYVEPFVGSGAIFFSLQPKRAIISDLNEDLICLYKVMQRQPEQLFYHMMLHHVRHSKRYYYKIRSENPKTQIERAGRFLYLNRTCWNGLYRVNLEGHFNVPIGTKTNVVLETDDFVALSKSLKCADIACVDFEETVSRCKRGDFLFVDPPYTVKHNYNNFKKYNETIFNWEDQVRLRDAVLKAKTRGVKFVVTNADHATVRNLYMGVGDYVRLYRHSSLAGDAGKRGEITEALFYGNFNLHEEVLRCKKQRRPGNIAAWRALNR